MYPYSRGILEDRSLIVPSKGLEVGVEWVAACELMGGAGAKAGWTAEQQVTGAGEGSGVQVEEIGEEAVAVEAVVV